MLVNKQLPDWYLARVVDQLGRALDPNLPNMGLFRVDYHDLAIQHLGSIYEGLLELHPRHCNETMIVVARRSANRIEERYIRESEIVPPGFARTDKKYPSKSIYLATDKGERRETGSYYTPDEVVGYIVENTLGLQCKALSDQLQDEIDQAQQEGRIADVQRLVSDFDRRVLSLRVLDPSMGSGHFLLRACQYLAEVIATHPYTGEQSGVSGNEASVAYWKRQVVECCLYGVDMNGLAVELAKLALWLETVSAGQPLSFLDHRLRTGNSLVGACVARMGALPGADELQAVTFKDAMEARLPGLLQILETIRNLPSDSASNVKIKEQQFKSFKKAQEPFRQLADLWCSKYAETDDNGLTDEQYREAMNAVGNPHKSRKLAGETWFKDALNRARRPDMLCFSWELEFPEVFFQGAQRHANAGFDSIIGNPPYDVLSELENDTDLTAFRAFIDEDPALAPSLRGKNNLYKLFVCKALDLLAIGGRLGFITPMAILGDDQAADLRRRIVEVAAFTAIEAFPQKDDPRKRIFPEAKLSTAVFTLVKGDGAGCDEREFRARVHPGRTVEADSPSLILTTAAIPLYDPSNFTIVSCGQDDWDLATRIMKSGRMARLKEFAEFFQGEVNETNERAKGNLANDAGSGKLVTRGAGICLYVTRPASQGEDLFLDVPRFLRDKKPDTKAFHHRFRRTALQESSPQNNFRRIIAAFVPAGEFCNHTVNYCPESASRISLELMLALLNSKLADWYFRLGSTNAHVSHYQLYNLPCPIFAEGLDPVGANIESQALGALQKGDVNKVLRLLQPLLETPPFRPAVRTVMVETVNRISALEAERGKITRTARSALAPAAQPYQDLIDRLLYGLAGLTAAEATGLEKRLATML